MDTWPLRRNTAHPILQSLLDVRAELGRGATREVYVEALATEFRARRVAFEREVPTDLWYRGQLLAARPTVAFVVEHGSPLDVVASERLVAADEAATLHHLRARGGGHGLVVNFGAPRLQVRRVHASAVLSGDALAPRGVGAAGA
ncbi:MAG TPA: GxxExxY protein [Candidatus Thermoplasmatota archaeon]|nr:GxxExxY protein [Candidatus Thermoplasmatota archaeon]